ncbi:hypothetical protein B484DRAFT_402529, partial [Ochromonadaceae sp. CCMP2298]
DKEFLRGEVTKGLSILLPTISTKVQLQFREVINTRDIAAIWGALRSGCGAATGSDGLIDLLSQFADLSIGTKEEMQDFLARAERTADGFKAFGAKWVKDGDDLLIQMRRALMHDTVHWETWKDELKASERLGEKWDVLINGQTLISQARDDERKKIGGGKGGGKADRLRAGPRAAVAEEEEVSGAAQVSEAEAAVKRQALSFECGLRGHIAAVCLWAKNFKRLRAECKVKQGDKTADKATPAAEESNCWIAEPESAEGTHEAGAEAACKDGETGAAKEPVEDWLAGAGGEHSLAAYAEAPLSIAEAAPIGTETHVEEVRTPADITAEAAHSTEAAHSPLSTLNRYAALANSGSDGEGPSEISSSSDSESSSDGEDSTGGSLDGDAGNNASGALQLSEAGAHDFESWLAGAQGATPLEQLYQRSGRPSERLAQRYPSTDMPALTRANSDDDDEDGSGQDSSRDAYNLGPLLLRISGYLDDFLLVVQTEEGSNVQDQGNVPSASFCGGFQGSGFVTDSWDLGECSSPAVEVCMSGTGSEPANKIMDSGCTSHSNGEEINPLANFCPGVEYISLGNAQYKVKSEGRGDLGPLRNVMWAPDMSYSMVSVSALDIDGMLTLFGDGRCIVLSQEMRDMVLALVAEQPQSAILMTASLRNRLYHLDEESAALAAPHFAKPYVFSRDRDRIMGSQGTLWPGSTEGLNALEVLHLRTGHSSKATILAGLKANAFRGTGTTWEACRALDIRACDSCLRGGERQKHVKRSSRDFSALKPMQEVGMDPVKLSTTSIGGENYMNFAHCYGTRLAAGVTSKEEGNQVAVLKAVQRDCRAMQEYLLEKGIKHDCSAPHQHAHNLVEGGCIRIILDRARIVLIDSGLPARYAIHTWNACLHPVGEVKTQHEKVTGRQPDISGARPFGALLFYFKTKEERNLEADPR